MNRKPWMCGCGADALAHETKDCPSPGEGVHRRRIFSLSLGDWLDPEVPIAWLARMLDTIRQCPDVDWLLCTKRPELFEKRMREALNIARGPTILWLHRWVIYTNHYPPTPPPNIVMLASVENQEQADKRIPELLRIPAWRRGLSCEPLLGAVDFHNSPLNWGCFSKVDWVIIGGESGNKARPCNVDWVRSLKDQCKAADVPCFVKQLGANVIKPTDYPQTWPGVELRDKKGGDWNEWPADLKAREFYKP